MLELLKQQTSFEKIVATAEWLDKNISPFHLPEEKIIAVSEIEMKRISNFNTPAPVMMVADMPEWKMNAAEIRSSMNLVLDDIQDPGNMGTIIRTADWFGINNIFCSEDCVDAYNPKTIQASMGSVTRVKVFETDIANLLKTFSDVAVYGSFLEGENIFEIDFPEQAFLIIGNEAHGISSSLQDFIQHRITIPQYGKAESLNAAVATGVICALLKNK